MSYILDALRKAESQRALQERTAPDPLAPSVAPAAAPFASAGRPRGRWALAWKVALGVVAAAALGAVAWQQAGRRDVPPVQARSPGPGGSTPTASPAATPTIPAAPAATATPTPAAELVARAAPAAQPEPVAAAALMPPAAAKAPGRASAPADPSARSPGGTPPSAVPPRQPARETSPLPLLSQLPPGVQQQVPPLALGGLVSSPQRSARLAIVNGQVLREGERPAPDLVLEEIRAAEVVFSMRGQRFLVRP